MRMIKIEDRYEEIPGWLLNVIGPNVDRFDIFTENQRLTVRVVDAHYATIADMFGTCNYTKTSLFAIVQTIRRLVVLGEKIQAIKLVRGLTNGGLMAAKEFCEKIAVKELDDEIDFLQFSMWRPSE